MPTWRPGRRRVPVAASAAVVSSSASRDGSPSRAYRPTWQIRAMDRYDDCGPIWYAAQFYAKPLSKVELVVKRRDAETGDLSDAPPVVAALLDRIAGPGDGGRSLLQSQYGKLRFLCGECYLLVTFDDAAQREVWEVVSVAEVAVKDGKVVRDNGIRKDEYRDVSTDPPAALGGDEAVVYRLWNPHPRKSGLADAPMRAVLDDADEFRLLSLAVRSRATSRAAGAGLLLYPDEASLAPAVVDPDDDPDADPFMRLLVDAMMAPISEPGAASAVVPITVRVPSDMIEHFRHIDLRPQSAYEEKDLRDEALRRIATGLDLPPEVLLGTADVNHWGSWLISEKEWQTHVEPVCRQMCEELTSLYLRPAARAAGVADFDEYVVWYDASAAVLPTDQTADAREAFDRYAISAEALRRAGGFDEVDAPTVDELVRRIALDTGDATLLATGEVAEVEDAPDAEDGDDDPADPEMPDDDAEADPDEAGDVDAAPPAASGLAAKLEAAADLVVDRARLVAGQRVLSRAAKTWRASPPACVAGAAPADVPRLLAQSAMWSVDAFGDPDALVAGAGRMVEARLAAWGIETTTARLLVAAAERFAADTLLVERPAELPPEVVGLCQVGGTLLRP